jgi:hypothetical protein
VRTVDGVWWVVCGMVAGESQLDESITAGEERGKYVGDIHNDVRHGVGTYE